MAIKLVFIVMGSSGCSRIVLFLLCLSVIHRISVGQHLESVSNLRNMSGDKVDIGHILKDSSAVLAFFSPDCPLSIKYSKTVRDIARSFQTEIPFYLVFSGKHHDKEDVEAFILKYKMDLAVLYDPKYRLADAVGAGITPEVFLVGKGRTYYSGAIDDWVIQLGRTKDKAEQHYLSDAIRAYLTGQPVGIKRTKAIGCFIK